MYTVVLLLAITAASFSATSAVLAILLYREVEKMDGWARVQTNGKVIIAVDGKDYDKIKELGYAVIVSEEDNSTEPFVLERRTNDEIK